MSNLNIHAVVEESSPITDLSADQVLEGLRDLSINDKVEALRKRARSAVHVAGKLALAGQITVFYAGPNTGKTLLSLKLISEAVQNKVLGEHVYHLNLDDDEEGLITKAELGTQNGYQVIGPEEMPNPLPTFTKMVDLLVQTDTARQTLFLLDTIKKFTDVMDKKASSTFMTTCRKLTAAGGTIIALAHVNKQKGDADMVIPAGTSDILDDCDCAYVLSIENEEAIAGGIKRYVKFENRKSRGAVTREALYSYVANDKGDYPRMFYSVKPADESQIQAAKRKEQIECQQNQDAALIACVTSILSKQPTNQTLLTNLVMRSNGTSRSQVVNCLDRWSCAEEDGGLWIRKSGPNNAKIYQLTPSETR